jgi:DNA-binding MarR family transcriptional regulator
LDEKIFVEYRNSLIKKNRLIIDSLKTPSSLEDASIRSGLSYQIARQRIIPLMSLGLVFRMRSGQQFYFCTSFADLETFVSLRPKVYKQKQHLMRKYSSIIAELKNPITINEASDRLKIKKTTLYASLAKLIDVGLVKKGKKDGRKITYHLRRTF